jgi:predicted  nucleic acid-binding Zn-ribbon protein
MATAAELFALQETDQALDRALARHAEIEAQLVESEELVSAREALEESRKAENELRSRVSDAEELVDEVRRKATEVEDKLYGGTVRNPKELSDLSDDLKSIKTLIASREDVELGILVEADEAEKQLKAAESTYADIEGRWKSEQEALLKEKAKIEPRIADLQARRDKESGGIDASSLRLYGLLRDRHGGQAVARLERGMCQGCRISLPMSTLSKARSGTGLVQCVSCERILLVS